MTTRTDPSFQPFGPGTRLTPRLWQWLKTNPAPTWNQLHWMRFLKKHYDIPTANMAQLQWVLGESYAQYLNTLLVETQQSNAFYRTTMDAFERHTAFKTRQGRFTTRRPFLFNMVYDHTLKRHIRVSRPGFRPGKGDVLVEELLHGIYSSRWEPRVVVRGEIIVDLRTGEVLGKFSRLHKITRIGGKFLGPLGVVAELLMADIRLWKAQAEGRKLTLKETAQIILGGYYNFFPMKPEKVDQLVDIIIENPALSNVYDIEPTTWDNDYLRGSRERTSLHRLIADNPASRLPVLSHINEVVTKTLDPKLAIHLQDPERLRQLENIR